MIDDPIERMIVEIAEDWKPYHFDREAASVMRGLIARIRQDYAIVPLMTEAEASKTSLGGATAWFLWARQNGILRPERSLADKIRAMIAKDGEGAAEEIAKMMEGE